MREGLIYLYDYWSKGENVYSENQEQIVKEIEKSIEQCSRAIDASCNGGDSEEIDHSVKDFLYNLGMNMINWWD